MPESIPDQSHRHDWIIKLAIIVGLTLFWAGVIHWIKVGFFHVKASAVRTKR